MTGLLNFNADRSLGFSSDRMLEFDITRHLAFDPNRTLGFHPNRDLGFGKRGVLFRGSVCGECGAITSPDATVCNECGAVFEVGETEATRPTPEEVRTIPKMQRPPASTVVRTPAPSTPRAEPTAAKGVMKACPNCGARTWSGDAFCWNCGVRFGGMAPSVPLVTAPSSLRGTEATRPPEKRARKVMKGGRKTESGPVEPREDR